MAEETVATPTETTDTAPAPDGINPAFKEESAPAESTAEKAVAAALRKLKVKGKEIEVDDAKYQEYAQKGAAATETWQEAARMKREAESFIHKLKNNPMEVLLDPNLGLDFRKIAEEYIWDQIQDEQLSPQEKAARDRDRELEKYKKADEERKGQEEARKKQELHAHYAADYDKQISSALSKSGLPKTTGTVRRMTDYMLHDVRAGISRDPSEYIEQVRQDYISDIQELFGQTDGDTLLKLMGDGTAKKLRESDLKRLKTTTPSEGHTFIPGKGMVPVKPGKKLSGLDWEKDVMKSFRGK